MRQDATRSSTRTVPVLAHSGGDSPFTEAQLDQLACRFSEETVTEGAFLFRRGDPSDEVFVLRSGVVELSTRDHDHRVAVQVLQPPAVFGDVPVLSRLPEPFDARALEDCLVVRIPAADFLALLHSVGIAQRWLVSVATRMTALQTRLLGVLTGQLEERLALLLLQQADGDTVRLSQDVLAGLLGVHRSSINRCLQELQDEGFIELGYRRIRLRDVGGLWSRIEAGGTG